MSLSHNPVLHSRTKYMEIDIFFVHEQVLQGDIAVTHLPSFYQIAYVLTKPISKAQFSTLRSKLNVVDFGTCSSPT